MRLSIWLGLIFLVSGVQAQNLDSLLNHSVPKYTLKIGVWPLLNAGKTALDLAADWKISDRTILDVEVGYHLASINFAGNDGESYLGPRLRGGFKYDLGGINMGLIYKYESVYNRLYNDLLRQGAAYVETYLINRRVVTHGLDLRLARAFPLSQNGRVIIEPFFRVGLQHVKVWRDIPEDAVLPDGWTNNDNLVFGYSDGQRILPSLYFGVNLGLAWWDFEDRSSKKRRRRR